MNEYLHFHLFLNLVLNLIYFQARYFIMNLKYFDFIHYQIMLHQKFHSALLL